MAFMASSVDDDSIAANARVWDFVMPPESCSTIPLSSEWLVGGCISALVALGAFYERCPY